MDVVMLWNLMCFAAFGLSVAIRQLPPHEADQPKALEAWLIEARTHDMGIPGYQDPIFAPTESQTMELEEHAADTAKK